MFKETPQYGVFFKKKYRRGRDGRHKVASGHVPSCACPEEKPKLLPVLATKSFGGITQKPNTWLQIWLSVAKPTRLKFLTPLERKRGKQKCSATSTNSLPCFKHQATSTQVLMSCNSPNPHLVSTLPIYKHNSIMDHSAMKDLFS